MKDRRKTLKHPSSGSTDHNPAFTAQLDFAFDKLPATRFFGYLGFDHFAVIHVRFFFAGRAGDIFGIDFDFMGFIDERLFLCHGLYLLFSDG